MGQYKLCYAIVISINVNVPENKTVRANFTSAKEDVKYVKCMLYYNLFGRSNFHFANSEC